MASGVLPDRSFLSWSVRRTPSWVSPNPMILLDNHRCHVDVNGAYLRLLGHPRTALIEQPGSEFVAGAPASEAEWRAAFRRDKFTGIRELTCDVDGESRSSSPVIQNSSPVDISCWWSP